MIYSNFDIMLQDIAGYIRTTGANVLSHDDQETGYIGYITEDQKVEWKIHLDLLIRNKWAFGTGAPAFTPPPLDALRTALLSAEGRQSIIKAMQKQAHRGVITDPERIARWEKGWRDRHKEAKEDQDQMKETPTPNSDKIPKQVEQLRVLLRDLFGIVYQQVEVVDLDNRKVALIDPWPLGIDKRQVDERLRRNGFEVAPLDCGPYSSAYWL